MVNLPVFTRKVREAQGIQQGELAKKIGVSQSAIAQFEKLKSSLSVDTLLKMAPILNLNPDFIQNRIGNPFKCSVPNKIIKMFLSEEPAGLIDFVLVEKIAEANKMATFLFLKPALLNAEQISRKGKSAREDFYRWQKQRKQGISISAIIVKDEADNTFIFKRKTNLLFDEKELVSKLNEIELSNNKYFETEIVAVGSSVCSKLEAWADFSEKDIKTVFAAKHHRNRIFILKFIGELWTHKAFLAEREKYEIIKTTIQKMGDAELDRLLVELVPDLAKVVTNCFSPIVKLENPINRK